MSHRYNHLLSPLKIGNVVLKNRMIASNALPHFLQGPETYPSDNVISFYANRFFERDGEKCDLQCLGSDKREPDSCSRNFGDKRSDIEEQVK